MGWVRLPRENRTGLQGDLEAFANHTRKPPRALDLLSLEEDLKDEAALLGEVLVRFK